LFNEIIGSRLKRIKNTLYVTIKLSITGLVFVSKKQTIDFEEQMQLFGILMGRFWKSSVLEAFVLRNRAFEQ
jgi:hypothetical protein